MLSFYFRTLKEDAIPSIFPGMPSYFTTPVSSKRSTSATSSGRHDMEAERIAELEGNLRAADVIHSIETLKAELEQHSNTPSGFDIIMQTKDGETSLYILFLIEMNGVTRIGGYIKVDETLQLSVVISDNKLTSDQYSDVFDCTTDQITFTGIVNLMSRVKHLIGEGLSSEDYSETRHSFLLKCAENTLREVCDNSTCDSEQKAFLTFIIEQLQLLSVSKHGRRYSTTLIILSYTLFAVSSTAYETLRNSNCVIIPSIRQLRNIANIINLNSTIDSNRIVGYLKKRVSTLSQFERYVVLILDEIHVARRVELTGGRILGFSSDSPLDVASTALCFMISSLGGQYRDIVGISPLHRISASVIHEYFLKVMSLVHSVGFQVVAVSADNLSANRSFYRRLNNTNKDSIQTHFSNPFVDEEPVFLFF